MLQQETRHLNRSNIRWRRPRLIIIRPAIKDRAVFEQDSRRFQLVAIGSPSKRRNARAQVVGLRRLALKNLTQPVMHSVGGRCADIRLSSAFQQNFLEPIPAEFEAIMKW